MSDEYTFKVGERVQFRRRPSDKRTVTDVDVYHEEKGVDVLYRLDNQYAYREEHLVLEVHNDE